MNADKIYEACHSFLETKQDSQFGISTPTKTHCREPFAITFFFSRGHAEVNRVEILDNSDWRNNTIGSAPSSVL